MKSSDDSELGGSGHCFRDRMVCSATRTTTRISLALPVVPPLTLVVPLALPQPQVLVLPLATCHDNSSTVILHRCKHCSTAWITLLTTKVVRCASLCLVALLFVRTSMIKWLAHIAAPQPLISTRLKSSYHDCQIHSFFGKIIPDSIHIITHTWTTTLLLNNNCHVLNKTYLLRQQHFHGAGIIKHSSIHVNTSWDAFANIASGTYIGDANHTTTLVGGGAWSLAGIVNTMPPLTFCRSIRNEGWLPTTVSCRRCLRGNLYCQLTTSACLSKKLKQSIASIFFL